MDITFAEISRMTLFRGFDEQSIELLDLFFKDNAYPVDTMIVQQGVLQKRFFMLVAGEVEVQREIDGQILKIAEIQAGQFFGEINLFDPGVATASVISLTPIKTLEISNDDFRTFITRRPDVAADFTFQLAQTIARRFRNNSGQSMEAEFNTPQAIELGQQIDNNRMMA